MNLQEHLQWISDSASVLMPEVILMIGIFLLLVLNIFKIADRQVHTSLSVMVIATAAAVTAVSWHGQPVTLFHHMLRADDFSDMFKMIMLMGSLLTVYMSGRREQSFTAEYFSLLLTVTLGANLLVMSTNLLMVVIAMELISLSSYVMAGYAFTKTGAEGSLKYFLFGSAATAVMIYGMSLLFGFTGNFHFTSGEFAMKLMEQNSPLLLMGGFFVLAGLLFKMSAAPFHIWTPDVYESAPMPVVAFFSVVPKLAGTAVLFKMVLTLHLFGRGPFDWQSYIAIIAVITLIAGNVAALWQQQVKRLMAWSSIAQAGFLLSAIAVMNADATTALLFYAVAFGVANFLVFIILDQFEKQHGIFALGQFSGLGRTQTFLSIALLLGLISLTGLPPTAGFTGKLFIFSALWNGYLETGKPALLWLLAGGLISTVISLFFYLKIPFFLFLKEENAASASPTKSSLTVNLFVAILVIAIVSLFFYPSLLMGLVNRVTFVL